MNTTDQKNKKNFSFSRAKSGATVLELLFYISFFIVLSLVVINAMITMTKSFREAAIQEDLVRSGGIMERMSREIRQAFNADSTTTDGSVSSPNNAMEFRLVGSNIELWDNGVKLGNLNSPNIMVTYLEFTQISTAKGKAIKIVLTVRSANDPLARTFNFYDTIVLRGLY